MACKFEPSAQLGNAKLLLNGAGVRYKALFKVYTAGLYLGGKASTPEAALAAPGPKRMHIVMLRDIDANELGKLFTRGMQDNAPARSSPVHRRHAAAGRPLLGQEEAQRRRVLLRRLRARPGHHGVDQRQGPPPSRSRNPSSSRRC
ncbi:chalcone isomerase family protein [Piscinibacter sp.]|uniref:chalcone isomerase family protein n=1 Tax=Piscinibacter sp. TaxID=1903157 RepID=UPI00343BF026